MFKTALTIDGPVAIRYPRGAAVGVDTSPAMEVLPIGTAETLRAGTDVAIIAIGATVSPALQAADRLLHDGIRAEVINARFVKPIDERMLADIANRIGRIVTVEENVRIGGFGSGVLECLNTINMRIPVTTLGIADAFFDHASQDRLRTRASIDADAIAAAARALVSTDGVTA